MSDVEKFLKDGGRYGRPDLAGVRKAVEENHEIINTAKDSRGWTGLIYAAAKNHVDIRNYLIANRANLDMQDSNGRTALHYAAYQGRKEAVEILLDAGADWKIKDKNGDTALDRAKEAKNNDWQGVVKSINDWTNKTHKQRQETIARTFNKLKPLRVPAVIKLDEQEAAAAQQARIQQEQQERKEAEEQRLRQEAAAAAERARVERERKAAEERRLQEAKRLQEKLDEERKEAEQQRLREEAAAAAEQARIQQEQARKEAEATSPANITKSLIMRLQATKARRQRQQQAEQKDNNDDDDDDPYKPEAYFKPDGTVLQSSSTAPFEPGKIEKFDDGTDFIGHDALGSGNSTDAYKITIRTIPKVLKGLQNDEELAELVATTAELAIHACFPFGGESRRQDYDRYCEVKRLVDPEPESIDEWLKFVEETFSSWDTKTINGRRYSIGALFDKEDESYDPYRDIIRLCYFYYLLQEKKLVHCDVAPRNVIITWVGPVLIDFGCTVKVDAMNSNALPRDVTPAYYMSQRGRILANHDLKGFYITACEHFGLKMDVTLLAKLNRKNRLTIDEVVLDGIRRVQHD